MLFLGTEKYPDEDDYENYLSQYGGFSNAYTDMEDTNYYFSVTTEAEEKRKTSDALSGALDRLAQFFIAPTFVRDAVDRELKAIDSEYTMSKTSDQWRNFQLLKSSCNQKHPFSNFGCGNYETLTSRGVPELLSELENFWKDYYQTYNLRLAVVGHASLDALQKTVEETFGTIPHSEGEHRRSKLVPDQTFPREGAVYGATAFGPEQLGLIRYIKPYAESRVIKIYFSTPPLDDAVLKSSKPYRVLSHILGHESPGSLYSLLNDEGYLTSLSSGVAIDTSDFSLFALTVSVTPEGMKNRDKVLALIFQWINLLREHQDQLHDHHDELRQISRNNFMFRENGDPIDFVSTASELLFDEETEPSQLLLASSDCGEYDPVIAQAFLDRIRPENCFITVTSSDLDETEGDWQTEKWYGAKYHSESLAPEQINAWSSSTERDERLRLPSLNKYIPTDFSLRCDDNGGASDESGKENAKLIIERPDLRLWHKMDSFWRVPKTFLRVALLSSSIYASPRSMTLNRLFQRVLNDDLNAFVYDAAISGCNYRVSCTPSGYRISVHGYSEKIPFLLDTLATRMKSIIEEMKKGDPTLQRLFDKAKEGLLRETKNYRLDSPHEVNSYNSRLFLEENVWYLDNYVDELEGEQAERDPVTMEECARAAESCFVGRIKAEALCMGNIDKKGALAVAELLDRQFLSRARPLTEVETPRFRSLQLPTRKEATRIFGPCERQIPLIYQELAYSETEENCAVELILQTGCELELGYEGMALLDLLTHIAYNSAFGQLRTKEQLGYYVSTFARKTAGGAWGMSVLVQSSSALPEKLEERIEAWLVLFRQELEEMTPASIAQEASAVVAQLLEAETKLAQEVTRNWGEILNTEWLTDRMRTPAFDRLERLARVLTLVEHEGDEGLTAEELKQKLLGLFDQYLASSAPNRRAMSARVYSHDSKLEYEAALKEAGVLSTFADMRQVKQYLSSYPLVPYWRVDGVNNQSK